VCEREREKEKERERERGEGAVCKIYDGEKGKERKERTAKRKEVMGEPSLRRRTCKTR